MANLKTNLFVAPTSSETCRADIKRGHSSVEENAQYQRGDHFYLEPDHCLRRLAWKTRRLAGYIP